jgi:hypothetical protein
MRGLAMENLHFDSDLSAIEYTKDSFARTTTGSDYFLLHYHDWKRPVRSKLRQLRPGLLFYVILAWVPLIGLFWLIHG